MQYACTCGSIKHCMEAAIIFGYILYVTAYMACISGMCCHHYMHSMH